MRPAYVYFILNKGTGHIKIGRSSDILSRIQSFQTANSYELKLLGVIRGTHKAIVRLERELKEEFQDLLVGKPKEWYFPSPQLEKYIKNYSRPLSFYRRRGRVFEA